MNSPCPNKELCGSCGWSHIPYEKQLQQKLSDINGSLALKSVDLEVQEILASPKTEHYRNRMDFVIDFEGRVGLRQKGKWWRVIDGHPCFLGDKKINALFETIRDWSQKEGLSYFDRKAHKGLLRYAVVRATSTGETMINIVTSGPEFADEAPSIIEKRLNLLAQVTQATTLIWSVNHTIADVSFADELHVIHGPGTITENVNGHIYRISPNAFFQTNSYAADLLLSTVDEFAGDLTGKTLLDLYCGSGFFSIALARQAAKTIGIELVPEAIADAKENARLNGVDIDYSVQKTEEADWGAYGADVVILDPPRSGMHDNALQDILRILPETIVYVSCNYKQFAREMTFLAEHYDVEATRAIDMFPHTPHVELVSRLVRKR